MASGPALVQGARRCTAHGARRTVHCVVFSRAGHPPAVCRSEQRFHFYENLRTTTLRFIAFKFILSDICRERSPRQTPDQRDDMHLPGPTFPLTTHSHRPPSLLTSFALLNMALCNCIAKIFSKNKFSLE